MNDPVDWGLAERVAARVASKHPGPPWDPRALGRAADDAAKVAEPLVTAWTGLASVHGAAHVEVVSRAQWARTNVRAFRRMLHPVTEELAPKLARSPSAAALTGRVAAVELGTLLGWLSRRVLGQYDLLMAGQAADAELNEENTGTGTSHGDIVYLVGPNMVELETRFGFPPSQFRLWVMLHELTHRAQFTGVPWMREHYLSLVHEALSLSEVDPAHVMRVLRESVQDRAGTKAKLAEGGLATLFATPRQQPALARIAGLMSLLEGHGDITMNRAGESAVPEADRFACVLAARREQAGPIARRLQRLVGLEAKLNQYASGARFIEAIEEAGDMLALCWEAPANLPTMEEIRQPSHWLARMGVQRAVA